MLVTLPQAERYRRPTFDDLMGGVTSFDELCTYDPTGTVTKEMTSFAPKDKAGYPHADFAEFNASLDRLLTIIKQFEGKDIADEYETFYHPKKSGGYRQINAPSLALKAAQAVLVATLQSVFPKAYHTNAFAYIEHRCTADAVMRHQKWESNWFAHFDFSKFYDSTTKEFLLAQMERSYPFTLLMKDANIRTKLSKALDICFLHGGLPQGAKSSPFLTNLMMIPFDYEMTNALRSFPSRLSKEGKDRFIYTRYADDIHISCRVQFDVKEIERFIEDELQKIHAPFHLNKEKTHFGNRSGQNWMLGYILNAENKISIGSEKKKTYKAGIHNFLRDRQNGVLWQKDDLQRLMGEISYWKQTEKDVVEYTLGQFEKKFGIDPLDAIKEQLSVAMG